MSNAIRIVSTIHGQFWVAYRIYNKYYKEIGRWAVHDERASARNNTQYIDTDELNFSTQNQWMTPAEARYQVAVRCVEILHSKDIITDNEAGLALCLLKKTIDELG